MATRLPAAERRAGLVEAALTVFSAEGFKVATMDAVAAEAGVTKPVLYQHFPSKRELFHELIRNVARSLRSDVTDAVGADVADLDLVIAHQANARILDATARKLGLPAEKVVVTVDQHANTSAASIPLALDQAVRDGRIQPGQLLALEAIGGGLAWGACLLRWGRLNKAASA